MKYTAWLYIHTLPTFNRPAHPHSGSLIPPQIIHFLPEIAIAHRTGFLETRDVCDANWEPLYVLATPPFDVIVNNKPSVEVKGRTYMWFKNPSRLKSPLLHPKH